MPLSVAVVGAGPAGFYAADAVLSSFPDAEIDIIEQWPAPFGLVRYGVAPDHLSTKNVTKIFDKILAKSGVRFVGNVNVGRDVTYQELKSIFDLVVISVGMEYPRRLSIPGADTKGVVSATDFVGWYNAVPDFVDCSASVGKAKSAVVIGNGNVALDIARLLAKNGSELAKTDIDPRAGQCLASTEIEDIYVVGRRGPAEANFSFPELSELGDLEDAVPVVDQSLFPVNLDSIDQSVRKKKERNLRVLESFSRLVRGERKVRLHLRFCASPLKIVGEGHVTGINLGKNEVLDGVAEATGEEFLIPTDLVIPAIGYASKPIDGVPYDVKTGQVTNVDGMVENGVYVVGWARRGSNGVIGTNRVDAREVIGLINPEVVQRKGSGVSEFRALLDSRNVKVVDAEQWQTIDMAEMSRAEGGRPRVKFNNIQAMLAI